MMCFDPSAYPFPSKRRVVYAGKGMVACSHPVAGEAGLRMLQKGGNAVDAAIAMAAALAVVEPNANSLGGDNFAIVWHDGKLHGMSASGHSPKDLTLEKVLEKGYKDAIPRKCWEAVTVPGLVKGWVVLNEKFGRLPFQELLAPAVETAEQGHALSSFVVNDWELERKRIHEAFSDRPELIENWEKVWYREGRPYRAGEIVPFPDQARALRLIAETKGKAFYEGEIAEAIEALAKRTGGYMTVEDMAAYEPVWHDPLRVNYRGYEICELPPNGQGIVALMALNILKGFDFDPTAFGSTRTLHLQMEAIKLAFADAKKYVTDPAYMTVTCEQLLSEAFADERRALVDESIALNPHPGTPPKGGTVYFSAADSDGTMISMIQSHYTSFGSAITVPGYGITLQNRGSCFSLEKDHDNVVEPRKRPYQTIIPAFIMKDGEPVGPFGVMGGFMQPQGHVQVAMNMIDFCMNPQAALDAPRFCWQKGLDVAIETEHNPAAIDALKRMGHNLNLISPWGGAASYPFGRGQIILRTREGSLCGGTEPRGDGTIYCR